MIDMGKLCIILMLQLCPSLLVKKDRGRPTDPKARPKAYGEANVLSNVPGVELLDHDGEDGEETDEHTSSGSDSEHGNDDMVASSDDEGIQESSDNSQSEDDDEIKDMVSEDEDGGNSFDDGDDNVLDDKDDGDEDESDDSEEESEEELDGEGNELKEEAIENNESGLKESKARKRKMSDFDRQVIAADTSLRALKRLAGTKLGNTSSDFQDGILSNEDFKRIKELKVFNFFICGHICMVVLMAEVETC